MLRRSFFLALASTVGLSSTAAASASARQALVSRIVPPFGRVADLLDNRNLRLGREVVEGDHLEAGGFRYRVAAQDADDFHHRTPGGVPLYILPNQIGEITVDAWGATGDGLHEVVGDGTDNAEVFERLWSYLQSYPGRPPPLRFASGAIYAYSKMPNWGTRSWVKMRGENTTLRNLGDGDALVFDAGGTPGPGPTGRSFGIEMTGFLVEGHRNSGHGLYVRSCHHSIFDLEVRGCGTEKDAFHLIFTVLCTMPLVASINRGPWYDEGRPKRGIFADGRAAREVGLNEGVTTCTFPDIKIEGCAEHGVLLEHVTQCRFVGGTSEGNDGPNFEIGTRGQHNVVDGVALEVTRSGKGFIDRGRSNRWLNLYNDAEGVLTEQSERALVSGGRHDTIIDEGDHNHFLHTEVGLAGGTIHLNGSDHVSQRVYRITTASYLPDAVPAPAAEPAFVDRVARRLRSYLPW